MQTETIETWLHTLQFFTKRFAQPKAYGDNCMANGSFYSAENINNIPTNCSLVSTSSDFTTQNLYTESLEESLATAQEYVAKESAPTPDKPDPADLLCTELDAQCKHFELIMKQNSGLLVAMAKRNGRGGGGGSGGGGGGDGGSGGGGGMAAAAAVAVVAAVVTDVVIKAPRLCAQTAISWLSTRQLTVSRSQQTRTRFQPGTSPPSYDSFKIDNWITRYKPKRLPPIITLCNYRTPLASQVKALDPPPHAKPK